MGLEKTICISHSFHGYDCSHVLLYPHVRFCSDLVQSEKQPSLSSGLSALANGAISRSVLPPAGEVPVGQVFTSLFTRSSLFEYLICVSHGPRC